MQFSAIDWLKLTCAWSGGRLRICSSVNDMTCNLRIRLAVQRHSQTPKHHSSPAILPPAARWLLGLGG